MRDLLLLLALAGVTAQALGAAGPAPDKTPANSLHDSTLTVSQAPQDTLAKPKSRADTVLVPKHNFNHRQQIITGSVVMSCLLVILLAMNNYNPR